jgi:hypothetical protein
VITYECCIHCSQRIAQEATDRGLLSLAVESKGGAYVAGVKAGGLIEIASNSGRYVHFLRAVLMSSYKMQLRFLLADSVSTDSRRHYRAQLCYHVFSCLTLLGTCCS